MQEIRSSGERFLKEIASPDLLFSCFSFLGLTPALRIAQQPPAAAYVDRPVASVTIEIEGRASTEPGLEEAVQTRTGAPLKMSDVRETITHLYSLGRFEDVQVEAEAAPNGGWRCATSCRPFTR